MANKPLQTIKFPGLTDTYTVPQVDSNFVGTAGQVPDSKKVHDEIDSLKEDLNANTGQSVVTGWESGYYVLNAAATTVDVENKNGLSSGYVATYAQCKAGDVFYVTSTGASAARSWAFLSSASGEGNIISKADNDVFTAYRVVAPVGSAYVVFNAKASAPYAVICGEYLNVNIIKNEANLDFLDTVLPFSTLADLPENRIYRTINASDRPVNQLATTGLIVTTIKPVNSNNYAQIGINAKFGRLWARYAGASREYSDWVEIGTRAANDAFVANRKTVRMLCIGNSFSQDSVAYMPFILRGLTDRFNLTLGIAYISGGTIADYVDRFDNDTANVTFNKLAYDSDVWTSTGSQTIKQILEAEPWDVVTFQQGSRLQESWENYSQLNTLIDDVVGYISSVHSKSIKAGWLMPQIRLTGSTESSYANMIECVKKVLETTPCSFVIPCGTAVHLARQTDLNSLGEGGGLTKDGAHLQEGLPCLLSAYVSTMKVLELLGIGYTSILGEKTRPIQTWIDARDIPGQNGTSVGVTDANCYLAQKIATQAIKFPYGEEES